MMPYRAARFGQVAALVIAAVFGALPARAQQPKPEDRFAQAFFAPELVMQHARAIGLTDEQRETITAAVQETQSRAVALQFRMLEQLQAVMEMIEQPRINEAQSLAVLNRVLDAEQEVKIAHSTLLIRIKNVLTQEQQARLRELRDRREEPLS
jgi:Spy/CpxP family protein refolding chaperone